MSFIIFELPEPSLVITLAPTEVITVNYGLTVDGESATLLEPSRREFSFVDADLTNNRITFIHNLGGQDFVDYALWAPQFDDRVTPDKTIYSVNKLTLDLSSFRPLIGSWKIMIERN